MENYYGTVADMVIEERNIAGELKVIAIDDKGLYLTAPRNVENGRADIHRYGIPRDGMLAQLAAEGVDVDAMLADNLYRVDLSNASKKDAKKLNPIKASKRL